MNALAHIDSKIWAILPSELNKLRASVSGDSGQLEKLFASREIPKPEAASASSPEDQSGLKNGTINESGIAVINVSGPLFNSECFWDELIAYYFGGTTIQSLMADVDAVANNPNIESVVFYFNSPGGEVFGINEVANKIASLTEAKNTVAYVYGYCCSAAYFLAAKCGSIVTDAQGWIGSIGVVATWMDPTGFYEMNGIAYEEITSSNAPFKRLDVRIPEERAIFMDEIDGIETVFIKSVAKGRGVSPDVVKSQFGAGSVMAGFQAVKAGMADSVGSFDDVIKSLRYAQRKNKTSSATADAQGDIEMSFKEKVREIAVGLGFNVTEADASTMEAAKAAEDQAAIVLAAAKKDEAADELKAVVTVDASAALAEIAELKAERLKNAAAAYVDGEIRAGRLLPAEKDAFASLYVHAATDDAASPLENSSRVAMIEAMQTARKPHGLDEEKINADTNQVVLAAIGGEASEDEKKRALLELTPLGKAALKLVKEKAA